MWNRAAKAKGVPTICPRPFYRRLGDKVGYVRQRGFEPLQHEQMVLQFAQSHGRITRAEVAQLCRLTSDQAKALLKRLVNKDLLVMTATRRGAYYEPKTAPSQKGIRGTKVRRTRS